MPEEKLPEGYFVERGIRLGVAIGMGIGVPLGLALDNPGFFGLGLPIGLAIGYAKGASLEKKAKAEGRIRPLTKKEQARKKVGLYAGLGLGILLFLVVLAVYLLR